MKIDYNQKEKLSAETVIIGGGVAGIFSALELGKNNIDTILIEKGGDVGGIALRSEANLDYCEGLSPKNNRLIKLFGNKDVANKHIKRVYKYLEEFGLPTPVEKNALRKRGNSLSGKINYIDRGIIPVDKNVIHYILNNIKNKLSGYKHLKILLSSEVINIETGRLKRWQIRVRTESTEIEIETSNLIIATGKLSAAWLKENLDSLKISYQDNSYIDIGVRVEGLSEYFDKITKKCLNPKIIINDGIVQARTFCWCVGGRVIEYDFCRARILDGQHLHSRPSKNTNFGIVVTIKLPPKVSNTDFGVNFAKFINSISSAKISLQLMRDFIQNKQTELGKIKSNKVKPSLIHFGIANLRSFLPPIVTEGVIKMIDEFNKTYENAIPPDCLIYAPVVERVFPRTFLSQSMETSQKGIFLIGDCSGNATGIITGATTGLVAADFISKICKK